MGFCNCSLAGTEACEKCPNNELSIYKLPKESLEILNIKYPTYNEEQPKRITKDEYYFEIAKAVSLRSTCLRRKYGAVIVNNDEVIATGYNGAPRGEENCDELGVCQKDMKGQPHWKGYEDCCSVHAEMNAIISASRKDMMGGKIYLYGYDIENREEIKNPHPCSICNRLIKNAGLTLVERG